MKLPHYTVDTPVFMPVGTQGTLKGLAQEQLEELDCKIMLGNTYHLGHRPVCQSTLQNFISRRILKCSDRSVGADSTNGRASASGAGGRGFDPGPRHTKGVKNGTSGYLAWRSAL